MKIIAIANNYELLIDDHDYLKVISYDWKLVRIKKSESYRYAYISLVRKNKKRERLYLHHLIFWEGSKR